MTMRRCIRRRGRGRRSVGVCVEVEGEGGERVVVLVEGFGTPPQTRPNPTQPGTITPQQVWRRLRAICAPEGPLLGVSAVAMLAAASVEVMVPHVSSQALSSILLGKGA
jgi:hypothetical protein